MLTRYRLEIDGERYELDDKCVKNWDEILCRYKRADYSGVVRSFTSQFEFVNNAYDLLLSLYQRDGLRAKAILTLCTLTDNWKWEERFSAPIDFTSVVWDDHVLKVNCIDNSLAALIKSNKSIKYEFAVGEDIPTSTPFNYDRVPMIEKLNYQVIGESHEDSETMKMYGVIGSETIPYVGLTTQNVVVNGLISEYGDQNQTEDSCILRIANDGKLHIKAGFAFGKAIDDRVSLSLTLEHIAGDGSIKNSLAIGLKPSALPMDIGTVDDPSVLSEISEGYPVSGIYVFVKSTNSVWEFIYKDDLGSWEDTKLSAEEYAKSVRPHAINEYDVAVSAGDKFCIRMEMGFFFNTESYGRQAWVEILNQIIEISWEGLGEHEVIETIAPRTLCEKILERISAGRLSVNVNISDYDPRFANTYLLAAESVRNIPGAKIYSSFTEFVDWMQTVFGYTYYIGDVERNPGGLDSQTIYFVHRSEIFKADADVRKITNVKDVLYSVDLDTIFSSVVIGYEKKDYEGENGRDEFNFNNTYSTRHSVTEKTLNLISKYRADSYGIEFATQKRGQDTTDSSSDKDIFFVLAKKYNGELMPDRSAVIKNAVSNRVFNGAFSPVACVMANAGYIGMQAEKLLLEFASSTGNSNIVIDGKSMSGNIEIDNPLMTCGRVEFSTYETSEYSVANEIIEITSAGITYQGFVDEAMIRYATDEAPHYKLLVRKVEVCY